MADITPNVPGGALPPKPAEAAKIQPKKETVRINLPPKPTSAPTIKLPTLPAGAPPPSSAASAAPVAGAPSAAPKAPTPPSSGTTLRSAPPGSSTAPRPAAAAPAAAPRPMAAPAVATVSGLDKGLAIGAAVCALIGLVGVLYLAFMVYQPAP
ncbi:MAG: hypothetical protein ACXWDN_07885 [Limisphaerales bacterium]